MPDSYDIQFENELKSVKDTLVSSLNKFNEKLDLSIDRLHDKLDKSTEKLDQKLDGSILRLNEKIERNSKLPWGTISIISAIIFALFGYMYESANSDRSKVEQRLGMVERVAGEASIKLEPLWKEHLVTTQK